MALPSNSDFVFAIVTLDAAMEFLLLYMIFFKTPKAMARFKIYLALLCLNSLATSVSMGFIWQPEFMTPPLCVYNNGLFRNLIDNHVMATVNSSLTIQYMQFLLLSYHYVYSKMNYDLPSRETYRRFCAEMIFAVSLPAINFALMFNAKPSDAYIISHTNYKPSDYSYFTCYFPGDFHADGLFFNYFLIFFIAYSNFFIFSAVFLLVKVFKLLRNSPSFVSLSTLKVQKMFFTNVVIQTLTPVGCVHAPVILSFVFELMGADDISYVLFKLTSISNALNSVVSCSCIIWMTKPYREFVFQMLSDVHDKLKDLLCFCH